MAKKKRKFKPANIEARIALNFVLTCLALGSFLMFLWSCDSDPIVASDWVPVKAETVWDCSPEPEYIMDVNDTNFGNPRPSTPLKIEIDECNDVILWTCDDSVWEIEPETVDINEWMVFNADVYDWPMMEAFLEGRDDG